MKKILFYTNGIYRGGIEIALFNLISHLDRDEYKVYVTFTDKNTFRVLEEKIGEYCEYVDIGDEIEVDALVYCNYVAACAEKDIVNIKYKKAYFWFHCFGDNQERFLEKVAKENKVDKIITVCDSVREELLEFDYLKDMRDNIVTIKNILDVDRLFEMSKDTADIELANDLNFIIIARLVKEKGFPRVKFLLECLEKRNVDYKVFVLGTANTEEQVQQIKNMFIENNRVCFLGYQENPYKFLKMCDYNLLLSDRENMSLSLLEAKILGIPNIVTDFRSAYEEVENLKNGIILSREDMSTYEERVDDIINLKEELKLNSQGFKYDINKILKQWENLL